MKIERFFFGMVDGKIQLSKTDGLTKILTDKNFQCLRDLTQEDNEKYLWLKTEQLVAFPRIKTVHDGNGRTFVQNETFLIPIHDYIQFTNPNTLLSKYFTTEWKSVPTKLETLEIVNSPILQPKGTGH